MCKVGVQSSRADCLDGIAYIRNTAAPQLTNREIMSYKRAGMCKDWILECFGHIKDMEFWYAVVNTASTLRAA